MTNLHCLVFQAAIRSNHHHRYSFSSVVHHHPVVVIAKLVKLGTHRQTPYLPAFMALLILALCLARMLSLPDQSLEFLA